MGNKINFSHYWVTNFGWEHTIFLPEDFEVVELLGQSNEKDYIFTGISEKGVHHIFKGYYSN